MSRLLTAEREAEIRASVYNRPETDRFVLLAEIDRLRAELADWKRSAEMACEQEPCGSCAGCLTAKDHYASEGSPS